MTPRHKGIIISKSGFQRGTKEIAKANGIALWCYDPERSPGFGPLVQMIDWEAVVRDFERKWLRRLRKIDYQSYNWICKDNLYSQNLNPIPKHILRRMLLLSFWPLWLSVLMYGTICDYIRRIRTK